MIKNKATIFFLAISFILASIFFAYNTIVRAESSFPDIQYPVQELGGCTDQSSCKTYCNDSSHLDACLDFARTHGLMSDEEITTAKKFIAAGAHGPGSCTDKDSCQTYCNDISHIDECVEFAQKNDLLPPQELEDAKKVQAAIAKGITPPACKNKKECDAYCQTPDHMQECIAFGESAGFIKGKDLDDAKKILAALKRGLKAPCQNKDTCAAYCSQPENMESCVNFAAEAGLMNEQEKADSQKMLQAIKNGATPPKCQGREECDSYCATDEHFKECADFAKAAGFIDEQEASMINKTKGKGPGNCKGRDECQAFCASPEHQQDCSDFAKEHNLTGPPDNAQQENDTKDRINSKDINDQGAQRDQERDDSGRNFKNMPNRNNLPCSSPEECQKMYGQQESQNQNACQGENCNRVIPSATEGSRPMPGQDFQQRPGDQPPNTEQFHQEQIPQQQFPQQQSPGQFPAQSGPASFLQNLAQHFASALLGIFTIR